MQDLDATRNQYGGHGQLHPLVRVTLALGSIARFTRMKRPIFLNEDVDAAQIADHKFVFTVIPLPLGTFWFCHVDPRIGPVHVGLY